MTYRLCVEENESRWTAHVPSLPGCFAGDADREAAIVKAAPAIAEYFEWLRAHGDATPAPAGPIATAVDELVRAWDYQPGYEVNAFFAADRPPLTADEIARGLRWLEWTRADLLDAVQGLSPDILDRPVEGDWNIRGILNHVGRGEQWYLSRLELALPRESLPEDLFERLAVIRAHLRAVLPSLAGDDRVVEKSGELWSPRKMLRRALWHERDHTDHVHQFLARLMGNVKT